MRSSPKGEPIDHFLASFLDRDGVLLELPEPLYTAANNVFDGQPGPAAAMLDGFSSTDPSEMMLGDILAGWALGALGQNEKAIQRLMKATAAARQHRADSAAALAATTLGTTLLAQGHKDDGFRLLAEAAATSEPAGPARFFALVTLGRALTFHRMPSVAEAVLAEATAAGPWPPDAQAKLARRIIRLRIDAGQLTTAASLLDQLPARGTNDPDRVADAVLRARFHAATGDHGRARTQLARAAGLLATTTVPSLEFDYLEAELYLMLAEGEHLGAAHQAIAILDQRGINSMTSQVLQVAIDGFTLAGNLEQAWRWSKHSQRAFAQNPTDLGAMFDLQIQMHDARERRAVSEEIEQKNAALRQLEARSAAVLAALAHGVRDPLTVLHLWLEHQRNSSPAETDNDPSTETGLRTQVSDAAAAAVERLERLLEQVVWLARLERFEAKTPIPQTDLHAMADRSIANVSVWADHRQITIRNGCNPDTETHVGEPVEGLEALTNALLLHSTAYTDRGGTIGVALERSQNGVTIEVADDGPKPLSSGETREGVAPGLSSRRSAGGDATGDIALLVAEGLAANYNSTVQLRATQEGMTLASVRITTSFAPSHLS